MQDLSIALQAQMEAVLAHLRQLISEQGGWLRFDDYMQAALYAPGLGYYVAGKRKFGAEGDFITAPEMGDLFGRCVARQCAEVLKSTAGDVLELGAGSGALAVTVLQELQTMNALPERYSILEVSPDLRAVQTKTLQAKLGSLSDRVEWLDALPEPGFKGVILANEVLDAIPVRRFCVDEAGTVSELGVVWEQQQLALSARLADANFTAEVLARKADLEWSGSGYCSEINLQSESWLVSLAERMEQGAMLLFDYGFPRHEFYHPDRVEGTLMCHYRHQSHSDALALPSLQDITAHVDFTGIAEAGQQAGLNLVGFSHQAGFLMSLGLLEMIPFDANIKKQLSLAQEVKKLTMPHEMGELFKAIAFTKNHDEPLSGFQQNNQSHRLWTTFKSSF